MNQKDLSDSLYEHRLLVLLEQDDGKFHQVGLTPAMFKKVSDDILKGSHKDDSLREGFEMAEFYLNPDWEIDADLFIGLESFYNDLENEAE